MAGRMIGLLFFAVSVLVSAQDAPRIIVGEGGGKVPLAFEAENGVGKSHAHWIGMNADKMMICDFPASETWREGTFTFTPKADGRVRFELKAGHVRKSGKPVPMGCYYDNIRVNGALIPNGGFEEGPQGFSYWVHPAQKGFDGRVVSDPSIAKTGNRCAVAWDLGPVAFAVNVRKDVPVTVSFDCRNAGLLLPMEEQNQYYPLSLAAVANMGFADETAGDGKGGWTDQGRLNDLRAFTPGVKRFSGFPFTVIDPAENNGKSCVILKSENTKFGSSGFTLPVNEFCNRIAVVTGTAWEGKHVADVTVACNDGEKSVFPLEFGTNIGGWWNPKPNLPDADLVWTGANNSNLVGLYCTVLKLPQVKKIRSITITPVSDTEAALGIVCVTAALIRQQKASALDALQHTITLDKKSELIALPLETVKMDMRRRKLPADEFFDELKNLNRVQAYDAAGRRLPLAIAKYTRKLAPVLLIRSENGTDSVTLKLGRNTEKQIFSPAEAMKRIAGEKQLSVNDFPWANGIMLLPRQAVLKNARLVRDADSLYQEAISFEPVDSEAVFTFELKEPATVKLFAYMRHPVPKSQSNRIRASFDGKPVVIVGGVFYKSLVYYWTGGERVPLGAGNHTLKLSIPCNPEERKGLEVARFYLGFDFHAPEPAGYADETAGLRTAGFTVCGDRADVPVRRVPSGDRLCRIVNAERSYPDLSSLVRNRIDERGALHPDGSSMRFDDGTELPFIWGRNIGQHDFYEMWKENRLGGPGSIDALMKRYKALGISSLRIFFYTMPRALWSNINNLPMFLLDSRTLTYHKDFLEQYQRLIAAAHQHGLYLKITFGAYPWVLREITTETQAMFYDPRLIDIQKRRMKLLLDTPNPFRSGIRPADDPTVAILEIENEVNFRGAGFGSRDSWIGKMTEQDRRVLYPFWHNYLKRKYKTVSALKQQWGRLPLRPGAAEERFENIEFAPVWNASEWGKDDSEFTVKLDDLRVTSASFGKEKRSNPAVSDGFEFMYTVYADYLKDMYAHLRSLGFKGIITTCGPDTENYYNQRAAANAQVDAVSGGTSYWNRNGYGFLRSLNWLNPLIHASAPDKPVISREYGPNLAEENSWWGCVISAAVQKAMGKAYLYDFNASIPGADVTPDYLYPEDAHEQRTIDLLHEMHFYCTMANTAAAIAVQSDELKKPEFKLDIAYPLDNVFYTAPFRGFNKMTIEDFAPFLYTDSNVRTFRGAYDGHADLVVNEPSTTAGDYRKAKRLFAIRPHSSYNRYGKPEPAWFADKQFSADGFLDTRSEQAALYDAIVKAGGKMPVTRDEYCKVWRDSGRKLEIDTTKGTFRGDTSTWGCFIGDLAAGKEKAPRPYIPEGTGDAWTFFGKIPEYDLFFAVMNGTVTLRDTARLKYLMLGSSDLTLNANGKPLVSLLSGSPVNIALKTDDANLLTAKTVYVTFFRSKSCQLPAELTFGRRIVSVKACNRDGRAIAEIPHTGHSFANLWAQGHMISHYEVQFSH